MKEQQKTHENLHSKANLPAGSVCCCVNKVENTNSNRWVANHLHGLIFELKEHMNSRQDRPVMRV
jgi:hypothetical protein